MTVSKLDNKKNNKSEREDKVRVISRTRCLQERDYTGKEVLKMFFSQTDHVRCK